MTETETPTNALARVIQPLEPSKAALVREAFGAMFTSVEEWQSEASRLVVTAEDQTGKMKRARLLRLEIREKRVALDKRRKAMKEGILLEGRAIDGAFAIFEAMASPLEKHLEEQETYAKRAEAARRDALRDARIEALLALDVGRPALPAALGEISEEAWQTILSDAKAAKDARLRLAKEEEELRVETARLLAEKRAKEAEEHKMEEAARLLREQEQAAENERLRLEIEAQQRASLKLAEELRATEELAARERVEAERQAAEATRAFAENVEQTKADNERERQAEREAAQARLDEQKRRADEYELAKRNDDEAKRVEAERAANAGARERLEDLAKNLRLANLPKGQTPAEIEIIGKVRGRLVKLAADIVKAAAGL
jgi:hypothetical protein